ncbi:MAG TPA: hypothetical protein VM889_04135 [Candidatus Thermoplasmatota archaeon]|nr:hypothetical protein [Candidatus Thermoplasmatota archaeon]
MAATPVLPLLAALVSGLFAAHVWRQYARRRKVHQLAWGLGLSLFALASVLEAAVIASGWTVALYRVYFPVSASLVGLLGIGTLARVGQPAVTRSAIGIFLALTALAALGQFTVPLEASTVVGAGDDARPLSEWDADLGAKAIAFPQPARVASLLLNVLGGLALIAGALWSAWKLRAWGLLLIGVGAMFPFLGGSLSTLGIADARTLAQLAGIIVMFAGYLAGEAAGRASRAAPATA